MGLLDSSPEITRMARERIVSGQDLGEEETPFSYALRPRRFADYIGQEKLLEKLRIAVKPATSRRHVSSCA